MTAGKAIVDFEQKLQADVSPPATNIQWSHALSRAAAPAANVSDRNVLSAEEASTSESAHLAEAIRVATAVSQRLRALANAAEAAGTLLRNRVVSTDASTATAVHNQQGQNSDVGATLAFAAIGQSMSGSVEPAADLAANPTAAAASSTNVLEDSSGDTTEPIEPQADSKTAREIQAPLPAGPPPALYTSSTVLLAAVKLQRAVRKVQQLRIAAEAKSSPVIISLGGSVSTKR